jgi:C-methyltransferase C-terminal domain/Putative zinc binding domain/Methyltransferase domain
MKHTCRVCGCDWAPEHLDFGPQALRNRFLRSPEETEFTHPLSLGVCCSCGIVQLAEPPPIEELRPRFGWIAYNEPERHLDELADMLAKLPGITPRSTFAGLTYKDDSTLVRLNRRGLAETWRPDLHDLGIVAPFAGIESVQEKLTPNIAASLAAKFGQPYVLLVRHVLEHTHNTRAALEWAAKLVRPGGYVVFEVPDAARALDRLDCTTVWEEHTLYFTPVSLRGCLERKGGLEIVSLESYPYPHEDSLVVIARSLPERVAQIPTVPREDIARTQRFIREFPRVRDSIQRQLRGRRIAMLGAGHLTGAFVNLYGLADQIEFVADDNPNKHGLFMPGSRLPILPSSELVNREIDLCLMTVRPEIEDAVIANNAAFMTRGGILASVFPGSRFSFEQLALPVEVLA